MSLNSGIFELHQLFNTINMGQQPQADLKDSKASIFDQPARGLSFLNSDIM